MARQLLDCHEAGQMLKVKARTVRDWARTGRLPALKLGSEYRVDRDQLNEWIDRQAIVAEPKG